MAKTYSTQAQTGEAGVALISQVVTAMGFIWHDRRVDHGIDGEIELVDSADRRPLNRVVLVQSKASTRPFPGENGEGFHYDASPDDVEYWRRANVPVVLVCSHPGDGLAWWAPVSRAQPQGQRRSHRIAFDKNADRFDAEAALALANLEARPTSGSGVSRPSPISERLVSNLLQIESTAETIWMAPTWLRQPRDAVAILRARGERFSDWILGDGMLFSFTQPVGTPLEHLVDGPAEGLETTEWAESKDADISRRFVRLLNQVLVDSRADTLRRHRDGWLIVRPSADLAPMTIKAGGSKGRGRTVFECYRDRDDPGKVRHYRHYSVRVGFVRRGGQWYGELQPSYHYTFDGHREVPWAGDLRKGIKQLEKNQAVRRLVEFWADYLQSPPSLFRDHDDRLVFGELATVSVDRGIHDPSWKTTGPEESAITDGTEPLWS